MKHAAGLMSEIGTSCWKIPSPEVVECAIVELLEIAQRHGITPTDFIQLLDSGMRISDFVAAMTPLANANDSIDCDS
ncbi:MAG: hypothetical protein WB992_26050 [Bryobacteraceae bacterium]|jgi:hypothetical protein